MKIPVNDAAVRRTLAEMCAAAGGQKAWALSNGLSQQYVSDVLKRRRSAGQKLLSAMGLERVVTYQKAARAANRRK